MIHYQSLYETKKTYSNNPLPIALAFFSIKNNMNKITIAMLACRFCGLLLCWWWFSDTGVMRRCAWVARLFWPRSLLSSPLLTTDSDLQTFLGKHRYRG